MNWEQARELPLGHAWQLRDLRDCFASVAGGVAFPGKNPGSAVVAGLRPVHQENIYEIHVLAEVESPDLGALLRQCRGLASTYHIGCLAGHETFRWIGDWKNAAGQRIVQEINHEGAPLRASSRQRADLLCISSTVILDMTESGYTYMVSLLRECLAEDHKQLFLHGSRAQHYLAAIVPGEISELGFGAFPAIEALAFVVAALRDEANAIVWEALHPRRRPAPVNPLDWILSPSEDRPGNYDPMDFI